jgi:hypothetical protein
LKIAFFITACIFTYTTTQAQYTDTLRQKYNNQTLYRYGSVFMKGTEKFRFADLEPQMKISEEAYLLYRTAKKEKKISFVLNLGSLVLAGINVAGLVSTQSVTTRTYILLGGQIACGIGAAQFGKSSVRNLDRAIWIRNREILFPR